MRIRVLVLALIAASVSPAQDTARMNQIIEAAVASKQFMGAALVARGNEVLFNKAYGSANLEWDIPNTPDTKFRLGSVTKQFTAASILLLEEVGKLSVDDPVKKHMPDAPAAWDKITIRHLLTHTSGIPSFTGFPDYGTLKLSATTPAKLVAAFRDKPLEFQPGEQWKYNNSGYLLLGYLIEKISGQRYADFVQEKIFTPLGMKDSGYDSSEIIKRRASGYLPTAKGPRNADFIDMSVPHAAGALYSTTGDLLRWEQGLFGGKVISPASLQKMITPFKSEYAFGLSVHTVRGRKVINHGGGIEGFNTMLAFYPDTKITVIVLGNLNGLAPEQIAGNLGAIAHGDKVELTTERKEITVAPALLSNYVGTYELAPGAIIAVSLEGPQLSVQLTGQPRFPVFAESDSKFFLKVVDAQIDFERDSSGAVTGLVLHQGGRDMKAPRKSSTVPKVEERKIVSVPVDVLKKYVGTYQIGPNFDLVVTLQDDHLVTQATGQRPFAIYPLSETRFFVKEFEAELDFEKDASGAVTAAMLHQGGRDTRAPRKL